MRKIQKTASHRRAHWLQQMAWKLQHAALPPWPGVIIRKGVGAASRHHLHNRCTQPRSLALERAAFNQWMDSNGGLTTCTVECTNANKGWVPRYQHGPPLSSRSQDVFVCALLAGRCLFAAFRFSSGISYKPPKIRQAHWLDFGCPLLLFLTKCSFRLPKAQSYCC